MDNVGQHNYVEIYGSMDDDGLHMCEPMDHVDQHTYRPINHVSLQSQLDEAQATRRHQPQSLLG